MHQWNTAHINQRCVPDALPPFSFISYISCLLSTTLQPYSHNFPSDNREELFKPRTIVAVVVAGDSVLGSGGEPCFFAYNVPESGITIIGTVALIMFSKHC